MPWTNAQLARLRIERATLARYFPGFEWKEASEITYIDGWMKTDAEKYYLVRLIVPQDIPNSVPDALIMYPVPLLDHAGHSLVDYGASARMHLLDPIQGYVRVCHYRSNNWTPQVTLYKVLIKVRLWLEAYEGHLQTGDPIEHYLKHQ